MKKRILLIEDNAQNRYMARFLLEQRGHEVRVAESGPQGLEMAAQDAPDLILLDIQLPGMDGHAVASALKGHPGLQAIPIIAVTSYAMVGDREKCEAAGAEGYIEKPINPDTFVEEVESFLLPRQAVRVLLVDDKSENLYILRTLLQDSGYAVDEAAQGQAALAKARAHTPHVIVSDLLMPVMDGYTLLRECRRDPVLKDIRFVVYTATYTDTRDERLARALGADDFVIKPNDPEELVARIQDVLKRPATEPRPSEEMAAEELEQYNGVLVRKLEAKALQLEQTNRKLVHSEELYRNLFESIGHPLFVVGRDTLRFLTVNPAALAGYGYSHREFISMSLGDLYVGGEISLTGVAKHRRKDGTLLDVELGTHSLRYDGQEAYVVEARDITEQRKLEDRLRQAQKMEAVGRLAGGVAHDFNNLLTVISGYCDLLLDDQGMGSGAREAITEIRAAGLRASGLTRQLLSFSRQAIIQPRIIDLNRVVEEAGNMLLRLIGEDVHLHLHLSPAVRPLRCDPAQIDQVLLNLAVNARDAMPTGGQLTIETADVADGPERAGPCVLLAVQDSGCGMGPEVLQHIFEPFFTTKAPDKGTGLGLATVFGIVEQSGGRIRVESEPGRGAAFRLYFPALLDDQVEVLSSLGETPAAGSETILLVEDDGAVRRLAALSLEKHGYRVLTACDGEEAVQMAEGHAGRIDLLLTDVVLPNLSGPRLAERIHERYPEAGVLFVSGYADDLPARHGLVADEVALLPKPYTQEVLVRRVREILDELTAGRAAG